MPKKSTPRPPLPVTPYGNIDIAKGLDKAFVHVPGKRLGPTCRAAKLTFAPALKGWNKYSRPIIDGVVIYLEDKERLLTALAQKKVLTPEQKEKNKLRRDSNIQSRFAKLIAKRFPSMPLESVEACASHACQSGSGRVGRSSVAEDPVRMAVIAHARHTRTPYEDQLLAKTDRSEARREAHKRIGRLIAAWTKPGNSAEVTEIETKLEQWADEVRSGLYSREEDD